MQRLGYRVSDADAVMPGGLRGYAREDMPHRGYDAELAGTELACMWLMSVNVKISSLTYNYKASICGDASSLGRSQ